MKLFKRVLLFSTIAIVASFSSKAPAQQLTPDATIWENNGNTTYEDPINWSDGVPNIIPGYILPGYIPDTTFPTQLADPGGSETITITGSSNQPDTFLGIEGSLEIDTVVAGVLTPSGENDTTFGTVNITFTNGNTLTLAGSAGKSLQIDGGDTLNFNGSLIADGSITVGDAVNPTPIGAGHQNGTFNLVTGSLNADNGGAPIEVGDGSTGTMTQGVTNQSSSTVITGALVVIGDAGGAGTYSLFDGSILDIGGSTPGSATYALTIGNTAGTTGTLNINDTSTVNAQNPGTVIVLGNGALAQGTINQSGNTNVTIGGAGSTFTLGEAGGTGTYNLMSGNLFLNVATNLGDALGSTGIVNQSGGTLQSTGTFVIGDAGTGTYTLSGGTATFNDGFVLGDGTGSSGTFTQSGNSTLTAGNTVTVGDGGTGTYTLQSGTATFEGGLAVGAEGIVQQNGGTLIVSSGKLLDLSAVGSTYNLAGGKLEMSGAFIGAIGDGTLNFAGGTLALENGSRTDALNGSVTGNSTIDTTNGSLRLTGDLLGNGTLTIIGGNSVSLDTTAGTSTFGAFTLDVVNGTLNAKITTFPAMGSLDIGSAGIANLAVPTGLNSFTGTLTGTGAFNVDFAATTATLVLPGNINFTGATTLDGGGTLQVYNGTLGSIGDEGTVSKVTIGGGASGGTVDLIGTNTYTGLTTVNDNFTLNTSNLSGSLNNLGNVGSGLTPVTLPATQNPTFTIGGNFDSSNAFLVNSNGLTTDLYNVKGGGTSTLSGEVVVDGYGTLTDHVIVESAGTLDTAGLTLKVLGANVLFSGTILQVGQDLELSTVQLPTADYARTPNERAVSGAIDPVLTTPGDNPAFATVGTALNNLTAPEIPVALDQLSPEVYQYSRDIAFENATFMVQNVDNVMANIRRGFSGIDSSGLSIVDSSLSSGLGRNMSSLLAYDPPYRSAAPNGVNYYPGGSPGADEETAPSSSPAPTWNSSNEVISDSPSPLLNTTPPSELKPPAFNEFVTGDLVLADLNKDQSLANAPPTKASYASVDGGAGISYRMTSNLSTGILFDYNHTEAKTDGYGSHTRLDSYSPGFFATYFDHGFYVNGLFSFGYNNYSSHRAIPFLGKTATSSTTGQQYVGNIDVGYDFQPEPAWIAGPTLGLTYTHLDVGSFNETGAPGANLAVNSQSANSLRSRLGGHVTYQTHDGSVLFQPNFTAMWQHEYLDNSSGITSQFTDFTSSPFTINTAAPSRDSALLGFGATATFDNSLTLYLNYLADVDLGTQDNFSQTVVGGIKAQF